MSMKSKLNSSEDSGQSMVASMVALGISMGALYSALNVGEFSTMTQSGIEGSLSFSSSYQGIKASLADPKSCTANFADYVVDGRASAIGSAQALHNEQDGTTGFRALSSYDTREEPIVKLGKLIEVGSNLGDTIVSSMNLEIIGSAEPGVLSSMLVITGNRSKKSFGSPLRVMKVPLLIKIGGGAAETISECTSASSFESVREATGEGEEDEACPVGFSLVGDFGKRGNFCISTVEQTANDYIHSMNHCVDQGAMLCTLNQWITSCRLEEKRVAAGETPVVQGMFDGIGEIVSFSTWSSVVSGAGGPLLYPNYGYDVPGSTCRESGLSIASIGNNPFRCCIQ